MILVGLLYEVVKQAYPVLAVCEGSSCFKQVQQQPINLLGRSPVVLRRLNWALS